MIGSPSREHQWFHGQPCLCCRTHEKYTFSGSVTATPTAVKWKVNKRGSLLMLWPDIRRENCLFEFGVWHLPSCLRLELYAVCKVGIYSQPGEHFLSRILFPSMKLSTVALICQKSFLILRPPESAFVQECVR
jgi:hypothetical protein